jgi:hypothetical protein
MTAEEVERTKIALHTLSGSPTARAASLALNRALVEGHPQSRLGILWAGIERVFVADEPKHMLTKAEIKTVIDEVSDFDSFVGGEDDEKRERLSRFTSTFSNPRSFPQVGIVERLADKISPIVGISKGELTPKLREASKLRGKHLHSIFDDLSEIEEAERLLKNALFLYIEEQMRG